LTDEAFDVVVVGAGAGGVAAAALLVKRGYRTLLVERAAQVGGRASTVDVGGFGINTGAQIFELGGANKELFDELGVPLRARRQAKPLVLRMGRRDIAMMSGPSGSSSTRSRSPSSARWRAGSAGSARRSTSASMTGWRS